MESETWRTVLQFLGPARFLQAAFSKEVGALYRECFEQTTSNKMCAWAAEHGHMHLLQWARANDCPWNAMTCEIAARGGHLELLQWARAMAATGIAGPVQMQRKVATWSFCSGPEQMAAIGIDGPVPMQQKMVI
jgi:hypothetical protein